MSELENKIEDFVNTVIEADCLRVLPRIPSHSVDMILCDLPYGTTQNKWDSVINLNRLWTQYMRIIKKNGVIVLTSQGIFTAKLILSNEKWFKYKIVWVKSKSTNFLNAKKQPLRKHEDICIFYDKQPTYHPQMGDGKQPQIDRLHSWGSLRKAHAQLNIQPATGQHLHRLGNPKRS